MVKTKAPDPTSDAPTPIAPARIKILERRLLHPIGLSSVAIDLKDPSLVCRWFNSAKASDQIWRAKQAGWEPVRVDDLADPDQVGGFTQSPEGHVTMGDRGTIRLMSMPRQYRDLIEIAKAKFNARHMGDPVATKNDVVNAAGGQLGDQAADFIHRRVNIVGGVKDQHEIVHREGALE